VNEKRKIRPQEKELILFLLKRVNLNPEEYPIREEVIEYEGGVMGSISMGDNADDYAGDIVQVEYIDSDNTPVVITLTKDNKNQLLDLDFWKTDFSRLITYPKPDQLKLLRK
jgi:hypothetical protein